MIEPRKTAAPSISSTLTCSKPTQAKGEPDVLGFEFTTPKEGSAGQFPSCFEAPSEYRCKFFTSTDLQEKSKHENAFFFRARHEPSGAYPMRLSPFGQFLTGCDDEAQATAVEARLNPIK